MRLALLLLAACAASASAAPSAERLAAQLSALGAPGAELPPAPAAPAPSAPSDKPDATWTGRFKIVYSSATGADARKWKRVLQKSGVLDEAVSELNKQLVLPYDVVTEAKDCAGDANAWYDPETRRITYCYDYVAEAARLLAKRVEPPSRASRLVLGDALHTFYHEMGHALIDVYALPAVGREEDAADQFATLVLLGSGEEGESAAVVTAMGFLQSGTEDRHLRWSDEHSMDKVRYYDTLCLIYGKDPEKQAHLVADKILPQERAEGCPQEFKKLDAAWDKLLAPYLRTK